MHEQSETVQDPKTKRWVNVYGRDTPKAGQRLPDDGEYGTVDEAVSAAKKRSELGFVALEDVSGFTPVGEEKGFSPIEAVKALPGKLARKVVGDYEGLGSVLSSIVAAPVAGFAGIGALAVPGVRAGDVVNKVQSALTFEPRTQAGRETAENITVPFEMLQKGIHAAGESGFEATGSPLVGAGIETGLNALLMLTPFKLLKGRKATPRPATPEQVAAKLTELGPEAAKPEAVAKVVGETAEPLFKQEVAPQTTKGIANLAKDFFAENPGLRDTSRLISDDIHRYVAGGAVPEPMLAKHGLTPQAFADVWRASISDHAKSLGYLSQVMREARAKMTPEEIAAIDAAGGSLESGAYVRPFWKKLTDTWRGLLVTQPATAVRNAITQVGRVGMDVIQAPIDAWIQKLTGRPQTVHPMDGFDAVLTLFQRNKGSVDKVLQAFPEQKARMFQRYLSDVDVAKQAMLDNSAFWGAVDTGVNAANILNRTQEFIIRRGIFQGALDVQMRNRGLNLKEILKNNAIGKIPEEAVKKAVDQSLIKTFAETPAYGTWQRKLIDAVNAMPGANIAIPFPRFMYNAIKFQYEHSPLGILSYLSPAERAAFAAGEVGKVSKAIIGSGLLGAAFLFRDSKFAGEKWYEAVNDKDEVLDLRPFNPFASYLFVADVMKKWKDGSLHKLTSGDVAQGLLSTNMRAGTGLFLLDSALNLMSKQADEKKFRTRAGELTAEFFGGFLTPLSTFRDAYDQITEGQSVTRDTRQEFLGPIKSRIPGVSQTLPEAEIPTREGPRITPDPFVRQLTGVTKKDPKNALEKELDRLGFERREILSSTGDKELDRKYAEAMGIAAERFLVPFVQSEKYQSRHDSVRGLMLSEALSEIRTEVRKVVNAGLPKDKQQEIVFKGLPPRVRLMLKEFGVKSGQ